jgi:hypothetical protein
MGVNKIFYSGVVLIDLSVLTVTPETLSEGVTALDATGALIVGTAKLSASNSASTSAAIGVSQVVCCGRVIFDATRTTVTPETLLEGVTALDAAGRIITGIAKSCTAVVGEAIVGKAIVGYDPEGT